MTVALFVMRSFLILGSVWFLWCLVGCDRYRQLPPETEDAAESNNVVEVSSVERWTSDHPHQGGLMGGTITNLGADQYHAEAVLAGDGILSILVLKSDETKLQSVPRRDFIAYLRSPESAAASAVVMSADPLESDSSDLTSRFSAAVPSELAGRTLQVTAPGLVIGEERFMLRFEIPGNDFAQRAVTHREPTEMPEPATHSVAETLYLVAGGIYTADDIRANGSTTAGKFYRGFQPHHDPSPRPGDLICPITKTKANPECTWVIGGQTYSFCCPPCIDEFVQLAKTEPASILDPEQYRR